jgi:O-antigen ligase
MKARSSTPTLVALAAALSLLGGCAAFEPPQAWEKGELAKPEMTMGGDPLDQRFTQHIYSSKENASGGYGVGGGGCGCN